LTIFALDRSEGLTFFGSAPRTSAAVAVWMSSPRAKISRNASSPAMWARIRSSIWL
jgi:hypothetical protein